MHSLAKVTEQFADVHGSSSFLYLVLDSYLLIIYIQYGLWMHSIVVE